MCGADRRTTVHVYDEAPAGEVRFQVDGRYRRELRRCLDDGHVVSAHAMDLSGLYEGAYVDATYGQEGMRRTFDRVSALPPGQSDNAGRVRRLDEQATARLGRRGRVLDVGSGTGVFPAAMQRAGWEVLASDPDARAVEHLREVAGVEAVQADALATDLGSLGAWDLVTFNKVLEHVIDPIAALTRAAGILTPEGMVYVEVPDAAAVAEGYGREEFFIEHHHVFTPESARLLALRSGLEVVDLEQLREPSSKYTIRLLLSPA